MKAKRCVIRAACLTLTAILLLLLAACSSLDAPAEVSVKIDDNGRMLSVKGSEDMTVGALLSRAKSLSGVMRMWCLPTAKPRRRCGWWAARSARLSI